MLDPYQTLGVAKTASAGEIKSAYRKLAKKLHPDVNPGRKDIEQKFKDVTAAYGLLSDHEKRARFDRGEIDAQGQERGFGGFGGGGGGYRNTRSTHSAAGEDPFSAFGGMEDIFAEFMGAGRSRRARGAGGMQYAPTGQAGTGVISCHEIVCVVPFSHDSPPFGDKTVRVDWTGWVPFTR